MDGRWEMASNGGQGAQHLADLVHGQAHAVPRLASGVRDRLGRRGIAQALHEDLQPIT